MNLFKLTTLAALLAPSMEVSATKNKDEIFETGVVPGMALRLEQQTMNVFKRVLQDFMPTFI